MKKRLLILCSVLVLIVALTVPAFASEATETAQDPLEGTWILNEKLQLPDTRTFYYLDFSAGPYTNCAELILTSFSLDFRLTPSDSSYSLYSNGSWVRPDFNVLVIRSKMNEHENSSALLSWLQSNGTKQAPPPPPPPPPVYQAVPDAVTGGLPGIIAIIGSILTSLFTPTGDLFQLGMVIAVCFGGAVIYGGVRLFRKLTPGV